MQILKSTVREKILNTATRLFASRGFNETSMRQIAKGSEITAGNIYHYFENKEEILDTILKPLIHLIDDLVKDLGDQNNNISLDSHFELHHQTARGIAKIYQNFKLEYIILLKRSSDTTYANYHQDLVNRIGKKTSDYCILTPSSELGLINTSDPLIFDILARNQLDAFTYILDTIDDPQKQEVIINQYLKLMMKMFF